MEQQMMKRDQTLLLLKRIVLETMKDVQVNIYLFGSWARQEEKRTSDIDVAFKSREEIPIKKWVELREKIEESTLPFHVDLVDLAKANEKLVKIVHAEGILWKDCINDSKVQRKP